MFTDMVGYTTLGQRNESLSLVLVDEHRKVIRPILSRHNGKEVKTIGDAFLVEFSSALDAIRCAYDIQRAIREFNFSLPEESKIHLRVGVHLGDVIESEGDISGDAVNIASRIEQFAGDGGVCLTRQVYDSVRGKFELKMQVLGVKSLKNVNEPIEVFEVVMPWIDDSREASQRGQQEFQTRVAILPFRNMSPDPNDEYFAEGLTEELISTVAKISELTVISRTSVMRYKTLNVPISQIGQELKVGSIVEGSVRKAGHKIRVTAQLIDVQSDGHLWAQNYSKDMTDIFEIQSDIAEQITNSLKVELVSGERSRIRKQATQDVGAYTLYLKGRHYWNERAEEAVRKALKYFEEAVKIDPSFAMAYSGISDCYNIMSDYKWMAPEESLPLAKSYALKALEADDNLAEAHASLSLTLRDYDWDFMASEREIRKAIELKPNYAPAHHWYGLLLWQMRRYEQAATVEKKTLELDPYSRLYNMANTITLLGLGNIEDASKMFEKLVESYPDFPALRFWKSACHTMLKENEKALFEAKKYVELDFGWQSRLNLAQIYALMGNSKDAEKIVEEAISASDKNPAAPTSIALVKLSLGQKEDGYAWLERAFDKRDPQLLYFNALPWTKEYRKDPRWRQIEARFNFKSEPDSF
jgi:adenylate cyclase